MFPMVQGVKKQTHFHSHSIWLHSAYPLSFTSSFHFLICPPAPSNTFFPVSKSAFLSVILFFFSVVKNYQDCNTCYNKPSLQHQLRRVNGQNRHFCTWRLPKFSRIRQYYHLPLHHPTGLWLTLLLLSLRRKPGCHSPALYNCRKTDTGFPKPTHYWKNKIYACQNLL